MHPLLQLLVVSSFLLAVVAVSQTASARLRIPETCLLGVVGISLGSGYLNLRAVAPETADFLLAPLLQSSDIADAYLWLFLPPLLFQLAIKADVKSLLADAAPVLVLAVVAVIVATAVIGLSLAAFGSQPLATCLLLGAIVATTDPSAVVGTFHSVGAPRRLTNLVEGESLLNDAAAIALVGALTSAVELGDGADWPRATFDLLYSFGGGVAIGYLAGRFLSFGLSLMGGATLAETALTLALPYPLYVLCSQVLSVSGVVAVVSAGLVVQMLSAARLSSRSWAHIQIVWHQIAMLAGTLVFVLASVRIPELLDRMTWSDIANIGIVVVSALLARLVVLFLLLPALTKLGLGASISTPYKLVTAWGGLRGAVTLVLAMGVSQNAGFPADVQHFIAVAATGFVIFSLVVNGGSLPWLIRAVGLDKLSPEEMEQQRQALAIAVREVQGSVLQLAGKLQMREETALDVSRRYVAAASIEETMPASPGSQDRLAQGLVILATKELDLIPEYGEGVISVNNLDAMIRNAGDMTDAARLQGRSGYHAAARRILELSMRYRLAVSLSRLGFSRPLESALADRFELLTCRCAVLNRLLVYNRLNIEPLLGPDIASQLESALMDRLQFSTEVLRSLRMQDRGFADGLERRLLTLFALRRGRAQINAMASERVISADVHDSVSRRLDAAWKRAVRRRIRFKPPS